MVCGASCRWLTADHWEKATITSVPLWSGSASQMCSMHRHIHSAVFDKFAVTAKFKHNHCPNICTYPLITAARNLRWPFSEVEYQHAFWALVSKHLSRNRITTQNRHCVGYHALGTHSQPVPQRDKPHYCVHHIIFIRTTNPSDCAQLRAVDLIIS